MSQRVRELDEILDELQREIGMRRKCYPGWVRERRMTQATADRQLKLMELAHRTILQQRVEAMRLGMSNRQIGDAEGKGSQGSLVP